MKLNLMYGTGVIVLPGAVYPDHMPPDASYLHILIALCADVRLLSDEEELYRVISERCRLPAALVKNAVAYWIDCGVLSRDTQSVLTESATAPASAPAVPAKDPAAAVQVPAETAKKTPRAALPTYPIEEYSRILTETDGLREAIDECARIAGKLFSEHEIHQLAALCDSYALDCEYLLLLFMYCKNTLGKSAVSYVVRTGLGLYDDGIRSVSELEAHIAARERAKEYEYQIRRLFGLGERALTAKEREYISAWTTTYAMPMEVITRAYEITVKNIDVPRMSYINKILSGWNENGIRTIEAVEAAEAEFERKKASSANSDGSTAGAQGTKSQNKAEPQRSYDLDSFLNAAMNRSFEDTD